MKTKLFTLFIFSLVSIFTFHNACAETNPALISVIGTAEVAIEPNLIHLQIESWGKSANAEEAQNLQAEQFKKLKSVVEKFKISKEDFKSVNFNIFPEYFYDQKTQSNKVIAYRVSHQISLTFKKIDQAGNLIDAITHASTKSNSGTAVQSIHWDSSIRTDYEKQALETAVHRARFKAEILAAASSVKIRRVYRINYNSGNDFTPLPQMEMAQMKAMVRSASTELAPGQIKLNTTVSMDFEIQ